MKTKDTLEAAREFVPAAEALVDSLGIRREKFQVRANRCDGTQGEQRDDLYYIWVGLRGVAPGNDAADLLDAAHARWRDAGWTITRYRHLDSGGVNVAATDPATGNSYALDSGFDEGVQTYIVGFFNTPCYLNPNGQVDFGDLDTLPATH